MRIVREFAKDVLEILLNDGRSRRARAARLRQRRRVAFATDEELWAMANLRGDNAAEALRDLQAGRAMFRKEFEN